MIQSVVPNNLHPGPVNAENQTQNVIKTAGGNVIKLEDEKGGQGIQIFSPTGNSKLSFGTIRSSDDSKEYAERSKKYAKKSKRYAEKSKEIYEKFEEVNGIREETDDNKYSEIKGNKVSHIGKNNTSCSWR